MGRPGVRLPGRPLPVRERPGRTKELRAMITDTNGMATEPESKRGLTDPEVRQVSQQTALEEGDGSFQPTLVECPACERDGTTTEETNVCLGCGAWFLVTPGGDQ